MLGVVAAAVERVPRRPPRTSGLPPKGDAGARCKGIMVGGRPGRMANYRPGPYCSRTACATAARRSSAVQKRPMSCKK